jgi:hypothetical protein
MYGTLSSRRALQALLTLCQGHPSTANELKALLGSRRYRYVHDNLGCTTVGPIRSREHRYLEDAARQAPDAAVDPTLVLQALACLRRQSAEAANGATYPSQQELHTILRATIRRYGSALPSHERAENPLSVEHIIAAIREATGLHERVWVMRRPPEHIRLAKHAAIYLSSGLTTMASATISHHFNLRTRTAVAAVVRSFQAALNGGNLLAEDTVSAALLALDRNNPGAIAAAGADLQATLARSMTRSTTRAATGRS